MSDKTKDIIAGIIACIIVMVVGSLIFWGLGNLVILVFKFDYVWTIWHGTIVMLIYILLKEIFGGNKQ